MDINSSRALPTLLLADARGSCVVLSRSDEMGMIGFADSEGESVFGRIPALRQQC